MLKKMKKYIAVLLTVTLICSFGLTGCGTNSASNSKEATAENPMVLTLAHGLSESHTVHIAMLQFAEEVKQKTNGRIIIKIFPNGQLGSETENLEQLQAGVIAMTKVSAPGLATYNDAYNTFGLPYIFSNIDEFYKIMDSDKMQDFFLSSEDDGFVTLTYFTSGSRSFYTKDKPIRKPAVSSEICSSSVFGSSFTTVSAGTFSFSVPLSSASSLSVIAPLLLVMFSFPVCPENFAGSAASRVLTIIPSFSSLPNLPNISFESSDELVFVPNKPIIILLCIT